MSNTNVLLLGRYGHPNDEGGVANAMQNMVRNVVKEGFDFHIFSVREGSTITTELLQTANYGIEQIRLDILPSVEGFGSRKSDCFEEGTDRLADIIMSKASSDNFNIIHVFNAYPNYVRIGEKLSERLKIPYIVSARGTDVYGHNPECDYEPDKPWFLRPLKNASIVTVLSDFQKEEVLQNLVDVGYTNIPIIKVHNGVDTDKFIPLDKVGIPNYGIRIAYTGRIRKFKRLMDIVQAVHTSRKSTADVEFDIYGPVDINGKEAFKEIQDYIETNNLSDMIRCSGGYVKNSSLAGIYRGHNLFMYASCCEGLPNAVIEAMACGLAVALNYASGSSELLEDRNMVFETGNIGQIVAVLDYLTKNPQKLNEHGKRNREFAINHHWQNIARQYCGIYSQVGLK